jgi:glycerophosphoryl diester phosphodiesterase
VQLLAASGGPWDFGVRRDLRGYAELASAAGLREVARYAQAIGPSKELVRGRGADGTLGARTQLVEQAHAAGLEVHAWTFRAENAFLPRKYRRGETASALGDLAAEIEAFRRTGIDGIFTDHPDIALAALVGARRADGWPEIA